MDSRELRGLAEAYQAVHAPQENIEEGLRSAVKRLLGGGKKEAEAPKPESRGAELRKKYNVGPEKSDTSAKRQILDRSRAKAEKDKKDYGDKPFQKQVANQSKAAHDRYLKAGYSKYGADDARGSGNKARKRAAALNREEFEFIVNALIEEGYDLSSYTWDEMYEVCLDEAVYGGTPKKPEAPKDDRYIVTAADKKANTKAYQNYKAGSKAYKAADHLGEGVRDLDPEKGTAERKARLEKKREMKLDDHPEYKKEKSVDEAVKGASRHDTEMRKAASTERKSGIKNRLSPAAGKDNADKMQRDVNYFDRLTKKNRNVVGLITKEEVEQIDEAEVMKHQKERGAIERRKKMKGYEPPTKGVHGEIERRQAQKPPSKLRSGSLPESYDLFDTILEYLVAEGYADTNESALVIMANMSEEWRQSIVEVKLDPRGRPASGPMNVYANPKGKPDQAHLDAVKSYDEKQKKKTPEQRKAELDAYIERQMNNK